MGGAYTAVYPFASPGGWNLIGTALDFSPFALALDDEVRFERAD
ncbi:MAG: carboxyltransferase domain-containing protein [Polyangiaceae bacterium]